MTTNDTTGTWTQRGSDIDGEAAADESGWSTVMSNDGNTITISAPRNDGAGADSGHIRIFDWSGSNWVQRGQDIDGEAKTFTNGDFSSSTVSVNGNVASIDGWDIYLEQLKLGSLGATGPSNVAGYATPSDSTPNSYLMAAALAEATKMRPVALAYNYSVDGSTFTACTRI